MNLWEIVLIFIYSRDSNIALKLAVESTLIMWCGTEYFRMNGQFQNSGFCSSWTFHSFVLLFSIWTPLISAPAPFLPDPSAIPFPLSPNHQYHYYSSPSDTSDTVWALFLCAPCLLLSYIQDQIQITAVNNHCISRGLSLLRTERSLPSHRGWE